VRRPVLLVLALASLFLSASCASDTSPAGTPAPLGSEDIAPASRTGIEGTVVRGPMCPVVMDGNPCPDQPFSALFHVLDDEGNGVAKFLTTAEGWFHIVLAPGDYVIVPDDSAPIMHPASQPIAVTVTDRGFATLTLSFDTGIR
jgi:hypothetical protein